MYKAVVFEVNTYMRDAPVTVDRKKHQVAQLQLPFFPQSLYLMKELKGISHEVDLENSGH